MSGAIRGVGKVFRSVTKSAAGKVMVGAAAAFLTAGLASTVLNATGLSASMSGTLGTVLSNALSGAAAGGVTSMLTGQNIGKGLALGGAGGVLVGGLRASFGEIAPGTWADSKPPSEAALGEQTVGPEQQDSLINTNARQSAVDYSAGGAAAEARGDIGVGNDGGVYTKTPVETAELGQTGESSLNYVRNSPATASNTGLIAAAPSPVVAGPGGTNPASPGIFQKGGWLERNQNLAGGAAMGLGQGALSMASADSQADAYKERTKAETDRERERADRVAASHSNTGLLKASTNSLNNAPRPTPTQRFDPAAYHGQFVYDPQQGVTVWVPRTA